MPLLAARAALVQARAQRAQPTGGGARRRRRVPARCASAPPESAPPGGQGAATPQPLGRRALLHLACGCCAAELLPRRARAGEAAVGAQQSPVDLVYDAASVTVPSADRCALACA